MSRFRDQLIRFQKKNYWRNLKHVRENLSYNPSLIKYENEYLSYLKTYEEISNKNELVKKVIASDLVYQGDYHTLRQSQRLTLRILRDIHEKRDIILLMEMFHAADQKYVDDFLKGNLTENDFIRKIDYGRKWPFSWQSWSSILYFCKERCIPVIGINSEHGEGLKSIRNRDQYAARVIVKTLLRYPEKLAYVIDGDFHISPNHLPKEVNDLLKLLDNPVRHLIIYQNAENLYWKLCKEDREEADVLKINENSYCVMNTMPANKIQSYLNWLEFSEDAYYPVKREWETEGVEGQGITIQEIIVSIASILEFDLPQNIIEVLSIHYADDYHFIDHIHTIKGIKGKIRLIKEKIIKGEAFLLEYEKDGEPRYLIYLPNSNINMAAEEASHFVNAVLRGPLKKSSDAFDRFYKNVITECLGFFGSKFINEKRKSHSENSIRILLGQIKRGEYLKLDPVIPQTAKYILQHFYLERQTTDQLAFQEKFQSIYESKSSTPTIFSTQLGYILGNKLYYAVKKGKFPLSNVREYLRDPFDDKRKAYYTYLDISERLKQEKAVSQY
ncbi:MAG: ChaN family lipoprotein [Proteobacteria bacterium]|nr:ChaN family lipoprotein [Pseudomonadota bacterium]